MQKNYQKVEDFKNLPIINSKIEDKQLSKLVDGFEVLDFAEIEKINGGKNAPKKERGSGCFGIGCKC